MKQAIEWTDQLSVGIDAVDVQHKSLIDRLNKVSAAMDSHQGEKEIGKTLDFLIKYTDYHFSKEEEYMQKYNYPGLVEQQEKHADFKQLLNDMEQEFMEDGATKNLADAIDTLLVNWLTKHIKRMDLELGKFLKENNIEISAEK